ncbi:GATA transcription factor 9-like [Cucurbita maxima]|uniref:GATA transcription factor n=1 Tax=Cucurbita maxima TaxID=3661 RepID=A0A6J1KFP8_CUCMA|nr:GATA transcription factor 9-like [Cucurbita maxima]
MEVNKYLIGGYFDAGVGQFSPEKTKAAEHFTIDDLLDFSNEDAIMTDGCFENVAGTSTDSSTVTAVDSCNSSVSGSDHHFNGNIGSRSFDESRFSDDLCVPYEELAELEWLSNFVDDSFSTEGKDLQALNYLFNSHSISKPQTPETSSSSELPPSVSIPSDSSKSSPHFPAESPLPCKARSKRSRTAPCDWTTRLLHLLTPADHKPPKSSSSSKKKDALNGESTGRKCLHCQAEKTPQWRTGPMGPKTLCNACGVRYKSGRLVPEYRPAASPTFISAKHSNSHRKVLELRRQKEVQMAQQQQFINQSSIFGVTNGCDEYLISHHMGPTVRHMM